MESKFDNPPKRNKFHEDKKTKHFTEFFFLSCFWEEPNVTDSQQITPPPPPKQSPLQSNEQFKIETSELIDTTDKTHNNHKICFCRIWGSAFSFWLKNSNLQKVCHNFPVCWKKNCQIVKKWFWGLCAHVNFATFQHTFVVDKVTELQNMIDWLNVTNKS